MNNTLRFILRPSAISGEWCVDVATASGSVRDNGNVWGCPTFADAVEAVRKRAAIHGWIVGGIREIGKDWIV